SDVCSSDLASRVLAPEARRSIESKARQSAGASLRGTAPGSRRATTAPSPSSCSWTSANVAAGGTPGATPGTPPDGGTPGATPGVASSRPVAPAVSNMGSSLYGLLHPCCGFHTIVMLRECGRAPTRPIHGLDHPRGVVMHGQGLPSLDASSSTPIAACSGRPPGVGTLACRSDLVAAGELVGGSVEA